VSLGLFSIAWVVASIIGKQSNTHPCQRTRTRVSINI
jgi:hypothetical protein